MLTDSEQAAERLVLRLLNENARAFDGTAQVYENASSMSATAADQFSYDRGNWLDDRHGYFRGNQ
jgi:hypothetical protein